MAYRVFSQLWLTYIYATKAKYALMPGACAIQKIVSHVNHYFLAQNVICAPDVEVADLMREAGVDYP